MKQVTYAPDSAGWLALASDARLLVVKVTDASTAELYWPAVNAGFPATVDALAKGGFSAIPSFALLEREGSALRVIVRGSATVRVSATSGDTVLDGAAVTTWTEYVVPDALGFDVSIDAAGALPVLPLSNGAAFASRLVGTVDVASAAPAIAEVPEATLSEVTLNVPDADAPAVSAPVEAPESDYDYLFGDTMYRNVADAAVHAPETQDDAPDLAGDHDGMTIVTDDIRKLRGERKSAPTPTRATEPEPTLHLTLSTGLREPLDAPIIIGRAPSASKVSGGALPRLVTIPGDQDISRNHAQVTVEGGTVVVTDLHSRNGTQVILPGKAPQRLRAGEPTSVIVGTVIDLGGGVTLMVGQDA
ncbi:FHA domain-containing protein [Cryobacterium sp. BB307]|uniref:FHA domain-containing protein n=1 Tax=Cryobacterium sp. BB307 TaxID=2716317 RepID=UPI0014483D78